MSEKFGKLPTGPRSRESADYLNHAFETSDIDEICKAIGVVTHRHNISDIAKKSGIERTEPLSSFFRWANGSKFQNRFKRAGRDGFPIESHGAPGRTRKAGAFSR